MTTILNRELVRKEIATGLTSVLVGEGKPCANVYSYRKSDVNGESPVVLVISSDIDRTIQGVGAKKFFNSISIELHVLLYDGPDNNPIDDSNREDAHDLIENIISTWVANNQIGTNYKQLSFGQPSANIEVELLNGMPYRLEIFYLKVEANDL